MSPELLQRLQTLFTSDNHPNESGKQYTVWDIFPKKSEMLEVFQAKDVDAARMTLDFLEYDGAHDMPDQDVWAIFEAEYDAY